MYAENSKQTKNTLFQTGFPCMVPLEVCMLDLKGAVEVWAAGSGRGVLLPMPSSLIGITHKIKLVW
jgi:hypothetical protein